MMLDCLVIGAGQYGLFCAHLLDRAGIDYLLIDQKNRVGDVWRERPLHLQLFTSRQFCRLGKRAMNGDQQSYPTGLEFADYLEQFADLNALRLVMNTQVTQLYNSHNRAYFIAELSNTNDSNHRLPNPNKNSNSKITRKVIQARSIIDATGANQELIIPAFAAQLSESVLQMTAQSRSLAQANALKTGSRISVVGDGASGRQIAREFSKWHRVTLHQGRKRNLLPNQVLGKDLFWWLSKTGILFAKTDSLIGQIMRKRDPIPASLDSDQRLSKRGVCIASRVLDAQNNELILSDASRSFVDAIVWCVGYQEKRNWLDLPSIQKTHSSMGSQGQTHEKGFFVIGRKWLSCRASELILGVEKDAQMVVRQVIHYLHQI